MPRSAPAFAACTIVATNYLAQALVLHDSLKRHYPDGGFRSAYGGTEVPT